jgi:two-component system nitrogen regulation sensor histidine kinase GlnL
VREFGLYALIALLLNLTLGFVVFWVNPQRRANRAFLGSSFAFALWLGSVLMGTLATDKSSLMFWIRASTATSALLGLAFDVMLLSIGASQIQPREMIRRLMPWFPMLAAVFAVVSLPSFVVDVPMEGGQLAQPTYGPGRFVYLAYALAAIGILVWRVKRLLSTCTGIERAELHFILLGFVAAVAMGIVAAHILPMVTGDSASMRFLPLMVVVFAVIVAYGIVTRRVMRVGDVLMRLTAYAMLVAYLGVLYGLAFWGLARALERFAYGRVVAQAVATMVVAFSLAPAHGRLQRVADKLFVNLQLVNVPKLLHDTGQAMAGIGPMDDLMHRVWGVMRTATGAERIVVLLRENHAFRQVYPPPSPDETPIVLQPDEPLPSLLRERKDAVVADLIRRQRANPIERSAAVQMAGWEVSVATRIAHTDELQGILLVGPRRSGRIYGGGEIEGLQLVCDHLSLAIENAKMYSRMQDDKVYNEILLDSLTTGVIAVGADRVVTVFNREAKRITGLEAIHVIGQPFTVLPAPLAQVLSETLAEKRRGLWDKDDALDRPDGTIPVRMSSSVFYGHTGGTLGALLVLNDLTLIKKLEAQVRHADRLASLGTMSAGMAHEIKNPLVALKAFTQLLPERHADPEFLDTAPRLMEEEITRIDSIVTRLLSFSRPARPMLVSVHMHEVLGRSLQLVTPQLARKGIQIVRRLEATQDVIRGDEEQLRQAFLNFFLNAMDAMGSRGTLEVSTMVTGPGWSTFAGRTDSVSNRILVGISDTGCGIKGSDLPRIFDPFFTTKAHGTGLGLSVSHGILLEHGASVDVESTVGRGTTFYIRFPLVEEVAS